MDRSVRDGQMREAWIAGADLERFPSPSELVRDITLVERVVSHPGVRTRHPGDHLSLEAAVIRRVVRTERDGQAAVLE